MQPGREPCLGRDPGLPGRAPPAGWAGPSRCACPALGQGWVSRWGCSVEVGGCEWGALGGARGRQGPGKGVPEGRGGPYSVLGPSLQEPPSSWVARPWAVPWALVTNLFHSLLTWAINCSWRSMALRCPCSLRRRPARPVATRAQTLRPGGEGLRRQHLVPDGLSPGSPAAHASGC